MYGPRMLHRLVCVAGIVGAVSLFACGHKSKTSSTTSPMTSGSAAGSDTGMAAEDGSGSGSGAKIACESAGGKCVGLTPTACADGKPGDATQYSCGTGVGVMCCLPK
jgi:hypothetical protein